MSDPLKIIETAGKVIEKVPEIYEDGVQSSVVQTGKLVERIPRFLNALAAEFDIWIMKREAKVKVVSILIEKRLENVPDDSIVSPEPHIAVPALQAISYSMDSNEIRELYANLLAKSMMRETKDALHPAFIEIIKQLSPREASNLRCFPASIEDTIPVVKYIEQLVPGIGHTERAVNVFIANSRYDDLEMQSASISLLQTLGLIHVGYDTHRPGEGVYDAFSKTALYLKIIKNNKTLNGVLNTTLNSDAHKTRAEVSITKGYAQLTPFGLEFYKICLEQ